MAKDKGDPQKKLVKDLINHYEPDAEVTDDYYQEIAQKYPNPDTLVKKLISHYEPEAEVDTEYLKGLYDKYGVKKKDPSQSPAPGTSSGGGTSQSDLEDGISPQGSADFQIKDHRKYRPEDFGLNTTETFTRETGGGLDTSKDKDALKEGVASQVYSGINELNELVNKKSQEIDQSPVAEEYQKLEGDLFVLSNEISELVENHTEENDQGEKVFTNEYHLGKYNELLEDYSSLQGNLQGVKDQLGEMQAPTQAEQQVLSQIAGNLSMVYPDEEFTKEEDGVIKPTKQMAARLLSLRVEEKLKPKQKEAGYGYNPYAQVPLAEFNRMFYGAAKMLSTPFTGSKLGKEVYNGLEDLQDYHGEVVYNSKLKELTPEQIEKGITGSISEGDYSSAGKNLAFGVLEALPQLAVAVAAPELRAMEGSMTLTKVAPVKSGAGLSANMLSKNIQRTGLNTGILYMGGEAGEEGYNQAIEDGLDPVSAQAVGFAKAMGVVLTESIFRRDIDAIVGTQQGKRLAQEVRSKPRLIGQGLRDYASKMFKGGLEEGVLEEGMDAYISGITDYIATGKRLNPYQIVDQQIVGFAAGAKAEAIGGVKDLVSVRKTSDERVSISSKIKEFEDLLKGEDLNDSDRAVLEETVETLKQMDVQAAEETNSTLDLMTEADRDEFIRLSQAMAMKMDSQKQAENQTVRETLEGQILALKERRDNIYDKYQKETEDQQSDAAGDPVPATEEAQEARSDQSEAEGRGEATPSPGDSASEAQAQTQEEAEPGAEMGADTRGDEQTERVGVTRLKEKARSETKEDFLSSTVELPIGEMDPKLPKETVDRITASKSRNPNEPVTIGIEDGEPVILDGAHRYYERLQRGDKTIEARFATNEGAETFWESQQVEPSVASASNEIQAIARDKNMKPSEAAAGVYVGEFDGVQMAVKDTPQEGRVALESIRVPEGERNQGKAKAAMQELVDYADENSLELELQVVPENSDVSAQRLEGFYDSFGFEKQGERMVRKPIAVPPTADSASTKQKAKTDEQRDQKKSVASTPKGDQGKSKKRRTISRRGRVPLDKRKPKSGKFKTALSVESNRPIDIARQYFISGGRILGSSTDERLNKGSVKGLLNQSGKEVGARLSYARKRENGGLTIDEIAHVLWEQQPDQDRYSSEDFRDAVEDVVKDNVSTAKMAESLNEDYGFTPEGETVAKSDEQLMEEARAMGYITDEVYESLEVFDVLTESEMQQYADQYDRDQMAVDEIRAEEITQSQSKPGDPLRGLAGQIRELKTTKRFDDLQNLSSGPLNLFIAAKDGFLETAATALEAGASLADATAKAVQFLKTTDWYKSLTDESRHKAIVGLTSKLKDEVARGQEPDAEMVDSAKKFVEAHSKALKDKKKKTLSQIAGFLNEKFFDRKGKAKEILRKMGATEAIWRKNLTQGASGFARKKFEDVRKKVFGKLSNSEKSTLNYLIMMHRTSQLDSFKDSQGQKRLKHTKVKVDGKEIALTKEIADAWIADLRSNNPKAYSKLNKRADAFFETNRELLQERRDEGLIDQETFDRMVMFDYSKRLFVEKMLDAQYLQDNAGYSSADIKALKEGSEDLLFNNAEFLIQQNIASTTRAVFENRANKALYNFAGKTDNTVVKQQKSIGVDKNTGEPIFPEVPTGYGRVKLKVDGKTKAMIMERDFYKSWTPQNPIINANAANAIQIATGTRALKMFATGINPFFALWNFPRDVQFALFYTDNYSNFLPLAFGQITKDLFSVSKDAFTHKGEYIKYLEEGGAMDFLTTQSRPDELNFSDNKLGHAAKTLYEKVGYINETSEIFVRLAVRERALKEFTRDFKKENGREPRTSEKKELQERATEKARTMMDFSAGGSWIKAADSFIPYINAAFQGLRVSARSFKQNPVSTSFKITQAMAMVVGATLYNLSYEEEDEENGVIGYKYVPDYVKSMGQVIMFPFTTTNRDNEKVRPYLILPLTHEFVPFKVMAEETTVWAKTGRFDGASVGEGVKRGLPLFDPRDVPIVDALYTYENGYDRFRGERVWKESFGQKIKPELEYYGWTPEIYKDMGDLMGMSPERLKAASGKVFTNHESNIYFKMIAGGYTATKSTMDDDLKMEFNDMMAAGVENTLTPLQRRFYRYPSMKQHQSELIEKAKVEEASRKKVMEKDKVYEFLGQYNNADSAIEKKRIRSEIRAYAETVDRDNPGAYDRIMNSFDDKIQSSEVKHKELIDISYITSPEARARAFYEISKGATPKVKRELEEDAQIMGVTSKRFWRALDQMQRKDK